MFDRSHDISVLNSLIETTFDSADGYRRAADEATHSRFSSDFMSRATEREQIVRQLQNEVRRLGGNPEDDGGILAAAHRTFLSLRDSISGSDDEAVIAEVDHGETYLKEKWEAAMKDEELSPETRSMITDAYGMISADQAKWRSVHSSMSTSHTA